VVEWFDDLAVGMRFKSQEKVLTREDIKRFASEFDPQRLSWFAACSGRLFHCLHPWLGMRHRSSSQGAPAMGPVRAQRCPVRLHALRTGCKRIQRPPCAFLAPSGAKYARRADVGFDHARISMVRALWLCYTSSKICNSTNHREGHFLGKLAASRGGSNLGKCNSWQTQPRISHRARGRAAHGGGQGQPVRASGRHSDLGCLPPWPQSLGDRGVALGRHRPCMCAGPRAGMPACIQYQPGKAEHCASSCAKHQHRPTSSCRNVAHLFP
jgi:hypothetical protein